MGTEANIGLDRLREAVTNAEKCVPSVSKWTVGMHIHHCCLSMRGILQTLAASKPPPPRAQRSLLASTLLFVGRIPRGRAQASEAIVPPRDVSPDELVDILAKSERMFAEVNQLDSHAWFKHFVFGVLERDKAVRFIRMHNRHHLKIISDILAADR